MPDRFESLRSTGRSMNRCTAGVRRSTFTALLLTTCAASQVLQTLPTLED